MRQELQAILRNATAELSRELDPDMSGLNAYLVTILTAQQHESVYNQNCHPTSPSRVQAILNFLQKNPDKAYYDFRNAVIAIGRSDLVDMYLPLPQLPTSSATVLPTSSAISGPSAATAMPPATIAAKSRAKTVMTEDHKKKLRRNLADLAKTMRVLDILDELIAAEIINDQDKDKILLKGTEKDMASYFLMNILLTKADWTYDALIEVLNKNDRELCAGFLE